MSKKLLSVLAGVLLFSFSAHAQVSITGTVTDAETGEILPGVSVVLEETDQGDATDANGEFEISNVDEGTYQLIATFVGYDRYEEEVDVGAQDVELDIEIQPEVIGLDDVVVTAFGIERDRRALGYGTTGIDSEAMERSLETDVMRSLDGNLPGVNVDVMGGVTGSGTDMNVRGFSSITGSNDPLFIVDGVRFEGGRNETDDWFAGGGAQTTPNRFMDLDGQNIKDVRVLKGLSASVLYGEAGSDGVVIITTESGSFDEDREPGFDVSLNQEVHATQIATHPDYQDEYGIGFDQNFGWFFSNWGPRFDEDNEAIFGASFRGFDDDGTPLVNHPIVNHPATAEAFPEYADETYRYEPKPDPMESFFETGLASTTSIRVNGGFEDLRLNVSYSRTGEDGYTPNNNMSRNSFGVGAQYRITPSLVSETSFNMSLTDVQSPPSASSFGSSADYPSVFGDIFYTPRSIDPMDIPYEHPLTGQSTYYRGGNDIPHPRWTAENALDVNSTNRYYGRTELNYEVTEGIHAIYRLGYDSYNEQNEYRLPPGGINPSSLDETGLYQTIDINSTSWDHNFNLLVSRDITPMISFDGTFGGQFQTESWERQGLEGLNQVVFGLFSQDNFTTASSSNSFGGDFQAVREQETLGIFGETTFGYDDIVYLNLAGRNDWFSTLEPENRSIFYPSASLSYILSDHLRLAGDTFNFLKLYAGIGSSAGQPEPYSTRNVLTTDARAFVDSFNRVIATNSTSSFRANPDLLPELHTETELGVEARFFEDRLGFDLTAYTRTTEDLITETPLDPSTGYTSTLINVGEIVNQGLEVSAHATPVLGELRWDIDANLAADRSEVIELGEGLDRIQVGGGFTNQGNFAVEGEPFQVMMGGVIQRTEDGTPIVDPASGNYIEEPEIGVIGDPSPDFTSSITNTFRYAGASLSFQFDYQQGGDMYSQWISTLLARGMTESTAEVDRNNTFILPGVNPDGSENNTMHSPAGIFFNNFGFGPSEVSVYDMTHIRLNRVQLAYELPTRLTEPLGVDQIRFSLTGNNLWFYGFNIPDDSGFDPNVSSVGGNARGFEYLTGPAARRFGGSVNIRF